MSRLIEAERAKHRDAAENVGGEIAPKKKPTANPPARQSAPRTNKGAGAKGSGKSTTNQGLR